MVETIKINGVDCFYLPNVNEEARDLLYGEDPLKTFTSSFEIEVYVTNVDGYSGEREFFSKFGLEIKNSMQVIMSKRSFNRFVPDYARPREGDLIYIPFLSQSGELYEIRYVDYSDAFYVLGNKYPYFYKLDLEKFKYSHEEISVGIPDIDNTASQDAYAIELNFTMGTGNYIEKEIVTQNTNSGVVASWDAPNMILKITNIIGEFDQNTTVIGATSNAQYSGGAYDGMLNIQEREMADNKILQVEANSIISIEESNPFGGIS